MLSDTYLTNMGRHRYRGGHEPSEGVLCSDAESLRRGKEISVATEPGAKWDIEPERGLAVRLEGFPGAADECREMRGELLVVHGACMQHA